MANMAADSTDSDLGRDNALASAGEIKRIREWSEAIEFNPFAYGPSIDKQRAIKMLLVALATAEGEIKRLKRTLPRT